MKKIIETFDIILTFICEEKKWRIIKKVLSCVKVFCFSLCQRLFVGFSLYTADVLM